MVRELLNPVIYIDNYLIIHPPPESPKLPGGFALTNQLAQQSVKIIPYFVRLFQLFGIGAAGVSVGFLIFEG